MEYKIKVFGISGTGSKIDAYGNPHQEDSTWPEVGRINDENDRIFIVCDGMGGHDDGEIASAVTAQALGDSLLRRTQSSRGSFNKNIFMRALDDAYSALDRNDTHAPKKMGTTMAALVLYADGFMAAHIGDSRIYHIRPGIDAASTRIIFCSEDHSLANSQRRAGTFDPSAPARHIITRAMQPNVQNRAQADVYTSVDVRPGDFFMVCSHGMLEYLDDDTIRYIFSQEGGSDRSKYNSLQRMTSANRDNFTAIVIHVEEVYRVESRPSIRTSNVTAHINEAKARIEKIAPKTVSAIRNTKIPLPESVRETDHLVIKFLAALMLLFTVIMIIYYGIVRHDEDPPEAGKASIENVIEEDYEPEPVENYGYETNPHTKIDDHDVGQGKDESVQEAPQDAVDGDGTENAPAPPEGDAPAPDPAPAPAPAPEPQVSE